MTVTESGRLGFKRAVLKLLVVSPLREPTLEIIREGNNLWNIYDAEKQEGNTQGQCLYFHSGGG